MQLEAIVEVIGFAHSNDRAVRLVLNDGSEVIGVPSGLDTDTGAQEAYLKPSGDDETEIRVSLGGIASAELV